MKLSRTIRHLDDSRLLAHQKQQKEYILSYKQHLKVIYETPEHVEFSPVKKKKVANKAVIGIQRTRSAVEEEETFILELKPKELQFARDMME